MEWMAGHPAGGTAGIPSPTGGAVGAVVDTDQDGLSDQYELQLHTDPNMADTDHDGLSDSFEVTLGTDPLNPDSDLDGLTDSSEVHFGSNPLAADHWLTSPMDDGTGAGDGHDVVAAVADLAGH
jgi:hypothetical protein